MPDAILGTTTTIQSLDGPVELEIRAGVQGGDVLTIKGRGITPLRGTQRGDLRVGVHVVTPTRLDGKQRALIEDFARRTKAPPPHLAEFHQGLFAKLRDRFRNG
jgi:molecular chaperone DnaJ